MLHQDLHDFASMLINESNDNKPLHDTGERFVSVQERIDDYRDELNAKSAIKLRRITVEYDSDLGYYPAVEPLPPFDPAKHGTKGNQYDEQPEEGCIGQ